MKKSLKQIVVISTLLSVGTFNTIIPTIHAQTALENIIELENQEVEVPFYENALNLSMNSIINEKDSAKDYRLNDNLSRAEAIKLVQKYTETIIEDLLVNIQMEYSDNKKCLESVYQDING